MTKAPHQQGFSLLEILVILVVIGMLYGVVSVSFTGLNRDPMDDALQQLQAQMRLAQHESTIRSTLIGVHFDAQGYRFLKSSGTDNWTELGDDPLLAHQELPNNLTLELLLDDLAVVLDDPRETSEIERLTEEEIPSYKPQLAIFPTGEITPFSIALRNMQSNTLKTMQWDSLGRIVEDEDSTQ